MSLHYTNQDYGYLRWEMLKLMENEIFKVDGTIFGGYVVDTIIHNHYAEKFYEEKKKLEILNRRDSSSSDESDFDDDEGDFDDNNENGDGDDSSDTETHDSMPPLGNTDADHVPEPDSNTDSNYHENPSYLSYMNSTHHPESWPHRVRQPRDIDFVIHPSKIQTFLANMKKVGYECNCIYRKPVRFYIPNILDSQSQIKHAHFKVSITIPKTFTNFIQLPEINMDMLIDANYEIGKTPIPYHTADFECHCLVLTKHGYTVSGMNHPMRKIEKVNSLIEDILKFRAVPVNAKPYRIIHMLGKGFTVQGKSYTAYKGDKNQPVDGHCLHCLESFKKTDYTIKNDCCEARYHIKCYQESQNGNQSSKYNNIEYCALCRRKM